MKYSFAEGSPPTPTTPAPTQISTQTHQGARDLARKTMTEGARDAPRYAFFNYFLLLYYASRLTERKTTTTTNDHQNHTPTPTPLPPWRNNNVLVWHKEELAHGCTTMNTKETA